MTLCMAAICAGEEGKPLAVVAADRMVTYGGFIEFEHTVPKMAHPTPYALAMIAGDTLMGTTLARDVATDCEGTSPPVSNIAERLAEKYVQLRRTELENQVLSTRGLDFQTFYRAHQGLNPQVVMMLDQQMAQLNLGVELILAGVDGSGAHLYSIHNPGKPTHDHSVIGHCAVGSGGIHALQAMIGFRHSPESGLRDTLFRVYSSKRRAEVAPGVGVETDLAIVSSSGVSFLSGEALKQLEDLYDNYGRAAEAAQVAELSKLNLDEDGTEHNDE